jgi:transcriptional regulator with XRE-family HTH domain
MANTSDKTLGEVIRDARVAAEMSLRDLSNKLDISPSYISDIENDRRVPSEQVMHQLADALKVSFDDLMARAGRVGDEAERYLKHHPTAGVLFRRISDKRLPEELLKKLLRSVEQMEPKKKGD